jgi:phosphate:Na+ symporter
MISLIEKESNLTANYLLKPDYKFIEQADEIENDIDALRTAMIDDHIKRLNEGTCSPNSSAVYINLVSNLERAGDHLNFIFHG